MSDAVLFVVSGSVSPPIVATATLFTRVPVAAGLIVPDTVMVIEPPEARLMPVQAPVPEL